MVVAKQKFARFLYQLNVLLYRLSILDSLPSTSLLPSYMCIFSSCILSEEVLQIWIALFCGHGSIFSGWMRELSCTTFNRNSIAINIIILKRCRGKHVHGQARVSSQVLEHSTLLLHNWKEILNAGINLDLMAD